MLRVRFKNGDTRLFDANHFDYDSHDNILLLKISEIPTDQPEFKACISLNEFLFIAEESEPNDQLA